MGCFVSNTVDPDVDEIAPLRRRNSRNRRVNWKRLSGGPNSLELSPIQEEEEKILEEEEVKKQPVETWDCPRCTYMNNDMFLSCEMCREIKPKETNRLVKNLKDEKKTLIAGRKTPKHKRRRYRTKRPEDISDEDNPWNCNVCGCYNKNPLFLTCENCFAERPYGTLTEDAKLVAVARAREMQKKRDIFEGPVKRKRKAYENTWYIQNRDAFPGPIFPRKKSKKLTARPSSPLAGKLGFKLGSDKEGKSVQVCRRVGPRSFKPVNNADNIHREHKEESSWDSIHREFKEEMARDYSTSCEAKDFEINSGSPQSTVFDNWKPNKFEEEHKSNTHAFEDNEYNLYSESDHDAKLNSPPPEDKYRKINKKELPCGPPASESSEIPHEDSLSCDKQDNESLYTHAIKMH